MLRPRQLDMPSASSRSAMRTIRAAVGLTVPMGHVVEYLQDYLSQHWPQLRSAQFKEPAYGVLALMEKWRVATPPAAGAPTPRGGGGDAMSMRGDA